MGQFDGKKGLILGVADDHFIAWAIRLPSWKKHISRTLRILVNILNLSIMNNFQLKRVIF